MDVSCSLTTKTPSAIFLIGFIRVSEFQLMSQERQVFTFVIGEPGLQHIFPDMALHPLSGREGRSQGARLQFGWKQVLSRTRLTPKLTALLSPDLTQSPQEP